MKTKKEIQAMIELLKLQRIGIPPRSVFGDDNHGKIDQQILVLGLYAAEDTRAIAASLNRADNESDMDMLTAHDWARGDCDEPPVEDDDSWVKKARAKLAEAAK